MIKRDVIVIGGGAGGLVTTSVLSQLGLKVSLFERQSSLGGDCLHYGCVPSKTLIHSAKVAHLIRHASDFGLDLSSHVLATHHVMQHVQDVVAQIQLHDAKERFESYGADILFHTPKFLNSDELLCGDDRYTAKRFVIATGSSPVIPEIPGLDQVEYLTNETIFSLPSIPKRLLVLGGGPVGVELAQAMQRLGSQVTIVETASRVLKSLDEDITDLLQECLVAEGVRLVFDHDVTSIEQSQGEITLNLMHGLNGTRHQLTTDAIVIATGRKPNIAGLGLDAADIATVAQGICVDKRLRSSQKTIYAVGDVVAMSDKFTHVAEYHAGIAIANIAFRWPKTVNYSAVPRVIYTDPEIASVGLTEHQAKQMNQAYEVHEFQFRDIDRALAEVAPIGKAKCLIHKGRLLGATIIGTHAGELIAEFVLVLQGKLNLKSISETMHAYPTLSQVNRRVVNQYFAKQLFSPTARRIVMWLNKALP